MRGIPNLSFTIILWRVDSGKGFTMNSDETRWPAFVSNLPPCLLYEKYALWTMIEMHEKFLNIFDNVSHLPRRIHIPLTALITCKLSPSISILEILSFMANKIPWCRIEASAMYNWEMPKLSGTTLWTLLLWPRMINPPAAERLRTEPSKFNLKERGGRGVHATRVGEQWGTGYWGGVVYLKRRIRRIRKIYGSPKTSFCHAEVGFMKYTVRI